MTHPQLIGGPSAEPNILSAGIASQTEQTGGQTDLATVDLICQLYALDYSIFLGVWDMVGREGLEDLERVGKGQV